MCETGYLNTSVYVRMQEHLISSDGKRGETNQNKVCGFMSLNKGEQGRWGVGIVALGLTKVQINLE